MNDFRDEDITKKEIYLYLISIIYPILLNKKFSFNIFMNLQIKNIYN